MTYQAYVIQKFNDAPFNVILGDDFKTEAEAWETIELWEEYFGKVECEIVEPSGTPIPESEEQKKSLWQSFLDLFR